MLLYFIGFIAANSSCKDACEVVGLNCTKNLMLYHNSTEMFHLTGISCNDNETSAVRKRYNESYDPSYDKDSKICQGYIGTSVVNCTAHPPLGIYRVCLCDSQGMIDKYCM